MIDTVLLVAKAPAAGRSKTRLVPPLSPGQAADLSRALLLDTLDCCRAEIDDVRLLHGSPADAAALARLAPDVPLEQQRGEGLADALRHGVAIHSGGGARVAIVASDLPGLPSGSLRAAFAALDNGADVVLGTAHDGGYWLIALREPHTAPFHEIPWSTPAVLAVTRQRCLEAGLRIAELTRWRDIDTLVDLAYLARDGVGDSAPRTRLLLETLAGLIEDPPPAEFAASELLLATPWRACVRDRLQGPSGETEYSYLAVPPAVFIAAVTGDERLLLVRQYRHPVRDWTLEVPAGSVTDGETALQAARRELREETGATAREWRHLSTFFSSSAHISLRSDAFLALGVDLDTPHLDVGEELAVVSMPFAEAVTRARTGDFAEGQTALTILLAAAEIERAARGDP